ncbi:fimbrial biogenesis chaperone [Bordetella genomosp. 8]|nr:molecular chaperone [Bordetella genomosp. 8]
MSGFASDGFSATRPTTLRSRTNWPRIACMMLACLLPAAIPVRAANLQISPITVSLGPDETATALTLVNEGDQPLYGQVRAFDWDQADGEDVLTPARDLIASPPLIEIAPRAQQIIRLLRTATGPVASEHSYRVLVDEIAPPDQAQASGVTVRLRYSIPVFVGSTADGQPALTWSLRKQAGGWSLEAVNSGTRRAQISAVQLRSGGRTYDINNGLLGYALAGRARRWNLPLDGGAALSSPVQLRARVNANPVEASVNTTSAR